MAGVRQNSYRNFERVRFPTTERRIVTMVERVGSQIHADRTNPDGCWAFKGELDTYHMTTNEHGRAMAAHRLVYKLLVGPLTPGLHLHHICRNPGCVNPSHLEELTPAEHSARHKAA